MVFRMLRSSLPSDHLPPSRTGVTFPVLAALDPKDQPQAIAFQTFVRAFGDVIGITYVVLSEPPCFFGSNSLLFI